MGSLINLTDVTKQLKTTTYTRGSDKCLLSQEQDNFASTEISCLTSATWTSAALKAKPFVDSYLKTHPKSKAQNIVFGPLTIKSRENSGTITASEKAGYDIAEAVIIDNNFRFLGLFYEHNSQWHFIAGANDEFGFRCADITTNPDARIALHDQICYDSSRGQIRLDSSRRALQ